MVYYVPVLKLTVASDTHPLLIAATADRRLHMLKLPSLDLFASYSGLSDAPILSATPYASNVLLCTTISGHTLAVDVNGKVLDKRKDHSKYVVGCAVFQSQIGENENSLIATAGWDNKVHIYRPSSIPFSFGGEPFATIKLSTKPEALVFICHPETNEPVLVLSRTDSSSLHFYTISSPEPQLLGRQNLAPHSNAWVAFTPSSLALHPTDPSLLAAGTNSIPHMKMLIVRLLVPPIAPPATSIAPGRTSLLDDTPVQETQASQARAALALADKEHAAILIHANTMAPQTAYSTPFVSWRPDGSGVWVNGDDGAVRGIEASTGKVVATLTDGHEAESKVRCLCAGDDGDGGEVMVSGGFDQKLVVWRRGE